MTELRLLAFLCYLSALCGKTATADLCGPGPVGTDVLASPICYPNGSVVITWSSTDRAVRRRQLEYQCYTNADAQPAPEIVLLWSTIQNGSKTIDNVWNENTTCIFSGCYETTNFVRRRIQATNCALHVLVVPTTISPPPMTTSVEPSSTFLITTPPTGLRHTSPPPWATSPTLESPTISATPTAVDSNEMQSTDSNGMQSTDSNGMQSTDSNGMQSTDNVTRSSPPGLGNVAVIVIAVCSSAVVLGIVVCVTVGLIILFTICRNKSERNYKFNKGPYKEKVDLNFYPVCITPDSAKSMESITTVLERLLPRMPAITDLKLVSGPLFEEDRDYRSISTQPAEDTDFSIQLQPTDDTSCSILMQPVEDTDLSILMQPTDDTSCSILMQPVEDTDAEIPTITPGVASKKDGAQPEEDEEDYCSLHIQPTEGTDREPATPVIAIPDQEVVKLHGTDRDMNTPLVSRGYIPIEQVLNPTTFSASN